MIEYVIEWNGIGTDLTDMLRNHVPPYLWTKRIREERLREPIVRCRDCKWFDSGIYSCRRRPLHMAVEPDCFCSWGELPPLFPGEMR